MISDHCSAVTTQLHGYWVAVCGITSIVAPDCKVTTGGNQMYVTLTLKGASGSGTQSLNIPCPKEMPVAH